MILRLPSLFVQPNTSEGGTGTAKKVPTPSEDIASRSHFVQLIRDWPMIRCQIVPPGGTTGKVLPLGTFGTNTAEGY